MLPGSPADSAARPSADRAAAAAGRLAAGLGAAFGGLAPLHWHLAAQPQAAPQALGAAWFLAGVAAWCAGAHRRSAGLAAGWLSAATGLWAGLSGVASPIETAAVGLAAAAVLLHQRNVNAPPTEFVGHAGVFLIGLGIMAVGTHATGVPIELGAMGRIGGYPRLALATGLTGVAIALRAWLDGRRAAAAGPQWLATLAGSLATATTLVLWWALRSREAGLAAASGSASAAPSQLPAAVLGMGLALAGLLAAVVALGQRARARSVDAQRTSHQLLEALVDRNIARDALERREALLQTVLETMGEGVVAASATGDFLVFNRAARELLGSDGDGTAIDVADMALAADPQVWPAGEHTLERALRGESIDDLDICLRRGDGREPRWVSVFARPLSLPAGINGSMLVLRDVTERRLAQERVTDAARELERSNRELTEFAAVASHDLRAPLRSVSSFVSLIEEDYGETFTDEGRTYVSRIKAAVSRMTGLIDGLLELARVRAKGEPFVPVPLGDVAQEVVADLAHGLAESGGAVIVGPLPTVEADRLQMRQLLQNLIGNAIKFRRPGVPPRVDVTAGPAPRAELDEVVWELRVADNGIGLDPAHAEKIFRPFERLHGHASYEGSGLGLAVCARIVERHGGRICADGRPGVGTTLIVTLPAAHRRREAA